MTLMMLFILCTEIIHSLCFVLCGTADLKIKSAKQINHLMRRLADCCYFPPSYILLAFQPSFPAFLLKLQLSRHEGPCGLDQMFQAAHFPTLCLMEYSWATRHHSTAKHHTDKRPFIYLFISSPCSPGCLMHNSLPYMSIFLPYHIICPLQCIFSFP